MAVGSRFQPGVSHSGEWENPHQFQLVTFEEAFYRPWSWDAHFVTYDIVPTRPDLVPLSQFPRLRKTGPIVEQLREIGYEVVVWGFGLDYDNEGHEEWRPGWREVFEARLAEAAAEDPTVAQASLLYYTRGGARVLYLLDEPRPVGEEVEAMHRSLVRVWACSGIRMDPLSDWTRFFRLPAVTRGAD